LEVKAAPAFKIQVPKERCSFAHARSQAWDPMLATTLTFVPR